MRKKIFLINILFSFILFEVVVPIVLKKYNFMTLSRYGIIKQEDFRNKSTNTVFDFSDDYNQKFLSLINGRIKLSKNTERTIETATQIREQLLNIASRIDTTNLVSRYPDKLFQHMISNKSLLCGEIAKLYGYILSLHDFNVRYITISRSIFDSFDRHSTIEIWDEKRQKWIISDPTFNVSFKDHDDFLSSDEIYDLIHSGNFDSIEVIHGNPTSFEEKLENYYISIFSLFDNVYYIRYIQHFTIDEIPPLRWFNDDFKIYLLQSQKLPVYGTDIKIQNLIVFFILFFFPVIIISLIACLVYLEIKDHAMNKRISLIYNPILINTFKKPYK